MSGNYRKNQTKIIYYFNIRITLANGQVVEGIREFDTSNAELVERIYRHKAELHYKHTYLTDIKVSQLSSNSLVVKMWKERQKGS
jgi:hypothetical protein